jgi:hypothetical protein
VARRFARDIFLNIAEYIASERPCSEIAWARKFAQASSTVRVAVILAAHRSARVVESQDPFILIAVLGK